MPTKEDLIRELDKEYIEARQKNGVSAEELYASLKTQVIKGNIKAIGLQVKLDDQMPSEKVDTTHHFDENVMSMAVKIQQEEKLGTSKK